MRIGKTFMWIGLVLVMVATSVSGWRSDPDEAATASTTPAPTPELVAVAEPTYAPVYTPASTATPKPTPEPTTAPTEPPEPPYSENEVTMLAQTVYGEAGICSVEEQRLVIWTVLQRVDDTDDWGDTITEVITARSQFYGYHPGNPVKPDIYALCVEELAAWMEGAEPPTHEVYAPTAPYFYFEGDGRHNWYREVW